MGVKKEARNIGSSIIKVFVVPTAERNYCAFQKKYCALDAGKNYYAAPSLA